MRRMRWCRVSACRISWSVRLDRVGDGAGKGGSAAGVGRRAESPHCMISVENDMYQYYDVSKWKKRQFNFVKRLCGLGVIRDGQINKARKTFWDSRVHATQQTKYLYLPTDTSRIGGGGASVGYRLPQGCPDRHTGEKSSFSKGEGREIPRSYGPYRTVPCPPPFRS